MSSGPVGYIALSLAQLFFLYNNYSEANSGTPGKAGTII
jgi:hypothetical protein